MQNRLRQAREERRISLAEIAGMLEVDKSTINNWEGGRRQMTAEVLLKLADILGFSVDYILGRDMPALPQTEPVKGEAIKILHGQPVWSASHGWMLVNTVKRAFVLRDLSLIGFDELHEDLYLIPPALSFTLRGADRPLSLDAVMARDRLWVEPISADPDLAAELGGCYHIYERGLAQNEFGTRFYLSSYGVKWLAFDSCFDDPTAGRDSK